MAIRVVLPSRRRNDRVVIGSRTVDLTEETLDRLLDEVDKRPRGVKSNGKKAQVTVDRDDLADLLMAFQTALRELG